jgi:hypothetical protein
MADVQVLSSSRLLFDQFITVDGYWFWDLLDLPTFVPRPGDLKYSVTDNDRIDRLAFRFYGDANFAWVIAWANGMEILPTDLKVNSTITIPDPNYTQNNFLPSPT